MYKKIYGIKVSQTKFTDSLRGEYGEVWQFTQRSETTNKEQIGRHRH